MSLLSCFSQDGPPERVEVVGTIMHECEGEMVVKLTNPMVPYFNAPIYLDKNSKIGKVDEVRSFWLFFALPQRWRCQRELRREETWQLGVGLVVVMLLLTMMSFAAELRHHFRGVISGSAPANTD